MNNRVLIFKEIFEGQQQVARTCSDLDLDVIELEDAKEVVSTIRDTACVLCVLDVSMPRLSGIECCRHIKDLASLRQTTVVLISTMGSESLLEKAKIAGADYCFFGSDFGDKVVSLLESTFPIELEKLNRKVEPRVRANGPVDFVYQGQKTRGELVNISRSGLLLVASSALALNGTIEIILQPESGSPLTLCGVVVRSSRLKNPMGNHDFAHGVAFEEIDEEDFEKIEWLLAYRISGAKSRLSADFVKKILDEGQYVLIKALGSWDPDILSGSILSDVTEFEVEMFNSDSHLASSIGEMLLWRFQCNAFLDFIPTIQERKEDLVPLFLPRLKELIEQSTAEERSIDDLLAEGKSMQERERAGLIDTANRLYEVRLKLLFEVDQSLSESGLDPDLKVQLKEIKKMADDIRIRQRIKI